MESAINIAAPPAPPATPPPEDASRWFYYSTPQEIGPYRIIRCLGSGGMSKVFLGQHGVTGQDVAIKVLRPDLIARSNAVQRFEVEFHAARKLDHPNMVRALDLVIDSTLVYLVLEFIDGPSVAQVLREKTCFSETQAVRWITQIAAALGVAHRNQLVHRDIKPGNILIGPGDEAKLADLGLAKDLLAKKELTQSGASLGTLLYMAPELYENARRADHRSDLYSLGVTLYQMLTGRFPFAGGQLTVLKNKLVNRFTRPRDVIRDLSPAIDDVVCRLLEAAPDRRPSGCDELIDMLTNPAESPKTRTAIKTMMIDLPSEADEKNRRREERYVTSIEGTCSMVLGPRDASWSGTILDVSSGGAHLTVERRFEVGSLINVSVLLDDVDQISFVLRVQWIIQEAANRWRLGGKFHRRLPTIDLERILRAAAATVIVQESSISKDF
jgi:eukaryotic-like serine/threonine-protein kinase